MLLNFDLQEIPLWGNEKLWCGYNELHKVYLLGYKKVYGAFFKVFVAQMLKAKYLNVEEVRQAQIYHKGEICAWVFLSPSLNPQKSEKHVR